MQAYCYIAVAGQESGTARLGRNMSDQLLQNNVQQIT